MVLETNEKEKAVKERALNAFYERGLYKTKQNTGVLFFHLSPGTQGLGPCR